MVNALFSATAGSGGLALAGLEVTSVDMADNSTVVVQVRSTSSAAGKCPDCGARRHVTGTRVARFKDIPREGHAVILNWRRRHFACTACHRPSHEIVASLEERHRVTTRLIDWIWQEAGQSTFIDMARRCGLSQRTVIVLFQAAESREPLGRSRWPFNLGVAIVQIAGLPRPVVLDAATGAVVEVFRSLERFETILQVSAMSEPSSHRLTLDLGLHELESVFRANFILDRFLVSTKSAARHAADLMLRAAGEAIAVQAKREGKAAKTRLILFSRRRDDLGRIGTRRLRAWSNDAPATARAYDLKEELLDLFKSWRQREWLDWKEKAARLPEIVDKASTTIDFGGVIALIDRYAEAIEKYQAEVKKGEFREYERTLYRLTELAPTGTRSFRGSCAAILQKFGRRPDSGGGAVEGEVIGESSP